MKCVDVNVLLAAAAPAHPHHAVARACLEQDVEPLGIPSVVVSGFLRIVTHRRLVASAADPAAALAFVDAALEQPLARLVNAGHRHWPIFRALVEKYQPRANEVPDVYLAALAIELGATWLSFDRGFAQFPEVRWINPASRG